MPRHRQLTTIASEFARAVVASMRSTIVAEVAKHSRARSNSVAPRRGRNRVDAAAVRDRILNTLNRSRAGMQVGAIAKKTGVNHGAVAYHLKVLRRKKQVRMVGARSQAVWLT